MNKGNQKKTTEKYLNYLMDLIQTHHLNSLRSVNLKDNELLKKYFPNREDTINQAYSYMIKQLLNLGIISNTNGQFIPKIKSRQYKVNVEMLINYCNELDIPYEFLFPNEDKGKVFTLNTNPSILPIPINDNKVEDSQLIKKIDKLGVDDLEPLRFKNRPENVVDDISLYYGTKIKYTNKVYLECLSLIDWINTNQKLVEYKMPLKGTIVEKKVYTTIKVTARQHSDYAIKPKDERWTLLKELGIDSEFDLHSAIFAVARLLNSGEFDIDWDLKREIFEDYDSMYVGEKEWVKNLLNRCFFTKTGGQAWSKYNWKFKDTPLSLTREEFERIYNIVQNTTFGSIPYVYNIFLYESLFELLILKELVSRGYDVVNVYDCFYFNSNQITEEEVKDIITQVALTFNDYLSLL